MKSTERVYLREWRLAKGLTQPELAKRIGTVKSEISRLEKGSRRMTFDWMTLVAKGMGISTEDLLTIPPIGFGAVSPPPKLPSDEGASKQSFGYDEQHAVTISGDDWAGTYNPGDIMLYDTSKRSTAVPGLFAIEIEGERLVRRITSTPAGPVISCSNTSYPPTPLDDDYSVLGRVVARVHRI